jgi:peptide/nickel transport system ATP-binding protein
VCREVHPEPRDLSEAGDAPHTAACVKHDAFDVGYDESPPIETEATGGFSAGLTETGGEAE